MQIFQIIFPFPCDPSHSVLYTNIRFDKLIKISVEKSKKKRRYSYLATILHKHIQAQLAIYMVDGCIKVKCKKMDSIECVFHIEWRIFPDIHNLYVKLVKMINYSSSSLPLLFLILHNAHIKTQKKKNSFISILYR